MIDVRPFLADLWITSDHYFGHANIVAYARRPFTPAEQDAEMARRWRETVPPDAPLLHLGDLVVGPFSDEVWRLVGTLPGRPKWLVLGNHDRPHRRKLIQAAGFTIIPAPAAVYRDWLVKFTHEPMPSSELGARTLNIHGHIHNSPDWLPDANPRRVNVSVEVTDYRPVRCAALLEDRIAQLAGDV